jgi:hypothetical protein
MSVLTVSPDYKTLLKSIHISDGKLHEVNILDQLLPEPGAFYIMDRGFLDFERLYRFHEAGSFFVTRGKSNLKVQRRYSHPVDRTTGLICDQSVVLTGFYSHQGFEAPLRRIRFTSENAVKSQIRIAVSTYVLVAIVKKRLHLSASLYEFLQILSLTMFEKIPLDQLLAQTIGDEIQSVSDNQLILFA